ncbi:MAG: methyltransferase domain-containing protein [Desulfobacteraceae bacterium]|nr:methyltransferase domain-containing protein [Desulfobacteraceae bacterium]
MGSQWQTDNLSSTYLEGIRTAIPFADENMDLMIRVARAWTPGVERFLDLGCGDGVLGRALQQSFPNAEAVFVDFSDPMIEATRRNIESCTRAQIIKADFSDPGWLADLGDNARFDLIVSGYAIHHLPDVRKKQLYAEIFGLLKSNSVFLNMEHVSSSTPRVEALHDEFYIDSLYRYHRTVDPEITRAEVAAKFFYRPDRIENILVPVELQCEWLRGIGFADVDCFFKVFELALFGGRKP